MLDRNTDLFIPVRENASSTRKQMKKKKWRKKNNASQASASNRVDCTKATWSQMEQSLEANVKAL